MLSSVTGESNVDWRDVLRPTGSCWNNGIYCLRTNISSSFSVAIIWNEQRKYNIICPLEEIPFLCLSSGLSAWDDLKHSQKPIQSMCDFVPESTDRATQSEWSLVSKAVIEKAFEGLWSSVKQLSLIISSWYRQIQMMLSPVSYCLNKWLVKKLS